jgi:bacterioferritin-associated ferredoxin
MYVCVCNGVTERDIVKHVESGTTSFEDIQFELGVATCCGQCADCARDLIGKAQQTAVSKPGA